MALVRARRVGGSLVVTLPKELVEGEGIKEGEILRIRVEKVKRDGFGILRNLSPFAPQDELAAHEE
ncbi:MAG: AbrB/MazE/SpoVT family DNA-binding domain-containing protein [Candidatus Bathyarchaeia archaeon]